MVFPSQVTIEESEKGSFFVLHFVCPMCGKEHTFPVDPCGFLFVQEYYGGERYAQDLPFAPNDREKLISGYCDDCQKVLFDFGNDEEEE